MNRNIDYTLDMKGLEYLFIFMMGSTLGWFLEVFHNLFFDERKLTNPGFLSGPYVPVYGFGLIITILLSNLSIPIYIRLVLFSLSTTMLELGTGLIFLHGYHLRLWSYSNRKFNYKGLICLRFSIYWTLISLIVYFTIFPLLKDIFVKIQNNTLIYTSLGFYLGVFASDVVATSDFANRIKKLIKEKIEKDKILDNALENNLSIDQKTINLSIFKRQVLRKSKRLTKRSIFFRIFVPFGGNQGLDLRGHIDKYFYHMKELLEKNKKGIIDKQ